MKTTRSQICTTTFVAASFFLASAAFAAPKLSAGDTIKLLDGPGWNGGGAFNASILTGASAGGSFQTFCLEYNEYFNSYGQTLKIKKVNTGAENGGVSGQTSPNFDPIDTKTAYLYTQFSKHGLSNYDYYNGAQGSAPAAATRDGTSLQLAFWILENEIAYNSTNAGAQSLYRTYFDSNGNVRTSGITADNNLIAQQTKSWLDEANSALTAQLNPWSGIGNVRVLNLQRYVDGQWINAQDQLAMVPEPETYAMLLAGLGLLGIAARRRRNDQR